MIGCLGSFEFLLFGYLLYIGPDSMQSLFFAIIITQFWTLIKKKINIFIMISISYNLFPMITIFSSSLIVKVCKSM